MSTDWYGIRGSRLYCDSSSRADTAFTARVAAFSQLISIHSPYISFLTRNHAADAQRRPHFADRTRHQESLVSFLLNLLYQPSPFASYLTTFISMLSTGHLYYGLLRCTEMETKKKKGLLLAEYSITYCCLFLSIRLPCLCEPRTQIHSKGTRKPAT
jgi:hypothetical protein